MFHRESFNEYRYFAPQDAMISSFNEMYPILCCPKIEFATSTFVFLLKTPRYRRSSTQIPRYLPDETLHMYMVVLILNNDRHHRQGEPLLLHIPYRWIVLHANLFPTSFSTIETNYTRPFISTMLIYLSRSIVK